jgi:hypothetical protein
MWSVGLPAALAVGAILAWQAGWVRFGAPEGAGVSAVVVTPQPVAEKSASKGAEGAMPASAPVPADAKAIKRQAEVELARARSEAQATLAAKPKVTPSVEPTVKVAQAPVVAVAREAPVVAAVQPSIPVAPAVVEKPAPAPVAGVGRFNGRWSVTVNCTRHEDGASGYRLSFAVDVKDGVLHGENGTQGEPDSLLMQGNIQPDGSALLRVKGLTGDPRYAIKRAAKGSTYDYPVQAQFDGSHGSGRRLQQRPCQLSFDKQ